MNESELLAHIYRRSENGAPGVRVGPGDDCAVIELSDTAVLLTVDQLIQGRHYAPGTTLADIAHKALSRSVSDIAAMGGRPRFALATAALPAGFGGADELFDLMHAKAGQLACPLVGGDIAATDGPATFTTTLVGEPHASRGPVLRSGARAGDGVYVTGKIGGAYASGGHLSFTPRVKEATALCDALGDDLHAMIDLSDGLGRDAGRVAKASGVRIEIDGALVPLHDDVTDVLRAAGDGEDYELLFTAAAEPPAGLATRIGRVVSGSGAAMLVDGASVDISQLGWDHSA